MGCFAVIGGVGPGAFLVIGFPVPEDTSGQDARGLHGIGALGQQVLAIQGFEKQGAQLGVFQFFRLGVQQQPCNSVIQGKDSAPLLFSFVGLAGRQV